MVYCVVCHQCDYKCSTRSTLKTHIKMVHDKIKDIECSQCDYKCSTRSTLKIHIKRVHDKIKDFECNQCDYKCSTRSNLTKHIKQVHDKIKNFECDKCGYKDMVEPESNHTLQAMREVVEAAEKLGDDGYQTLAHFQWKGREIVRTTAVENVLDKVKALKGWTPQEEATLENALRDIGPQKFKALKEDT